MCIIVIIGFRSDMEGGGGYSETETKLVWLIRYLYHYNKTLSVNKLLKSLTLQSVHHLHRFTMQASSHTTIMCHSDVPDVLLVHFNNTFMLNIELSLEIKY